MILLGLDRFVGEAKKTVPKGFSRFTILTFLLEEPCLDTTKIREKISTQFNDSREISTEQVYQMLGKLLRDGLIEEENAKYRITAKGIEIAANVESINNMIKTQFDFISKAQSIAKFVVGDFVEKFVTAGSSFVNHALETKSIKD
ncbi:MAG: PadR family transcriptional regulator [Nitrososphaeraceae archaeon]